MEMQKKRIKESKSIEEEVEGVTEKVVGGVSVKEVISPPANLELDDLRMRYADQPERFNSWYCTVNFPYEGKECLLKFCIIVGTLMPEMVILNYSQGPLSIKKEKNVQILEKPSNFVDVNHPPSSPDAFKYSEDDEMVAFEMDELSFICNEEEQKVISSSEELGCDLTFKPRGPPLFWAGERGALSKITEGTQVRIFEALCNAQGKIIVNGKEIKVKGTGVFEHAWINKINFFEIRQVDWIYTNFDNMYLFLFPVDSVFSDGRPRHYVTGGIYNVKDNDYIYVNECEVVPGNWAFIEECYRFIPTQWKIKAETDKGVLNMNAAVSIYPQFIFKERLEDLCLNRIYAWNVNYYDTPIICNGEFVYNNGKTVKLTNGKGMNETIRVVPL